MKTPDYLSYSPWPSSSSLSRRLERSFNVTKTIIDALLPGQQTVARLPGLNPPYWEFGHLTWFHEFWVHRGGNPANPSFIKQADALFNSSVIAHADRWLADLPPIDVLMDYAFDVMERTTTMLQSGALSAEQAYFVQLAIFHQDMHNEAFAYMWQFLGYRWPFERSPDLPLDQKAAQQPAYIDFSQTRLQLGSAAHTGFMFDNEKWQHEILVPPFSIATHAVSNAEYLEFLQLGCHTTEDRHAMKPAYWRHDGGQWFEKFFDQWLEIDLDAPVRHISASKAERYCSWRGLRLPTEHELSVLMASTDLAWTHSKLWEWTSSAFLPFEGFSPDPYHDYSAPWFDGKHRVLKGWSAFTVDDLRRSQYRNFYLPSRHDFFCGFRTCFM